jgi:hypothetical protein
MAVNTNHTQNKIVSSENDLILDTASVDDNINVSNNRITDLLDPIDNQDAVTKIFLETTTGVLRENRIYTNNIGRASTKILFKGRGKVKAGFKHCTGKTEIEIR